jgi:carbon storage regulator
MLILTRRISESLVIDDHIYIKVLDVKGATVRLGIEAPVNVNVNRAEVQERKRRELLRSPGVSPGASRGAGGSLKS